jgi:hypothetical protein
MKAQLPHQFDRLKAPPQHYSYTRHRKQIVRQIILPVILSSVLMIALIVWICMATFSQGGDVGRWAAISTMWIVTPVMLAGIVVLALLGGLIYLMARALGALPYYTGIAQDYVYIGQGYVKRFADLLVKPIIGLNGWIETIKEFIGRITP